MRVAAFALSVLVLGSLPAAAEQGPNAEWARVQHRSLEVAAIGGGALLGFFVAERLAIAGVIGSVAGSLAGLWWIVEHEDPKLRPEIKPSSAPAYVAPDGLTPTLVIRRISRVY